jgi:hypothetical protein
MAPDFLAGIARTTKRHVMSAVASARLLYNYLRLSPTYAAGCFHKLMGSKRRLNSQGQKVLSCVKRYRDVHHIRFEEWINGPGKVLLEQSSPLPQLMCAKSLTIKHESDLFIRFPKGVNAMPQLELLAMIAAMVPTVSRQSSSVRLTPVVAKNLWRDLYLAYLIKNYPDAELWRLGAEAMLVDRFIGRIEPTGRRMNSSQDHERRLLVATVIRHRQWAANISEQAAIDNFPCKDAVPFMQHSLDLSGIDLTAQLRTHSQEEAMYARQQVILCTGAMGRVSATPSFKHQGLLF